MQQIEARPPFRIRPSEPRLVVRRVKQEKIGGIYQPDGSTDNGTEAIVDYSLTPEYPDGTVIFISRFVGVPVDVDGNEDHQLWIIKVEDVLGVKEEAF
jgi:co-chaperonin GroES (HSP10)